MRSLSFLAVPVALALYFFFSGATELRADPSFDCNRASSSVEITICSHSGLAALDTQMADLYNRARRDPYVDRNALLASQRRWWRQRESQCGRSRDAVGCLVDMYIQRNQYLSNLLE
jgi:uncharacterized protein